MQILAPTNCPSCNSSLEFINDRLYCKNLSCPAKTSKAVEHFAKTLKIKGLGPATIDKLEITSIEGIYDLTLAYCEFMLDSEKLASKLISEIENSKKQPLNILLAGFGIPLVGSSASDKLSKECESIFDITVESCKKAGLGEKATNNLLLWLNTEFQKYEHLDLNWYFDNKKQPTVIKGVVCITGKLKSFPTKNAAKTALEQMGFIVRDTVTKDVTILLNESGIESAKTQKARQSGITVIENINQILEK